VPAQNVLHWKGALMSFLCHFGLHKAKSPGNVSRLKISDLWLKMSLRTDCKRVCVLFSVWWWRMYVCLCVAETLIFCFARPNFFFSQTTEKTKRVFTGVKGDICVCIVAKN